MIIIIVRYCESEVRNIIGYKLGTRTRVLLMLLVSYHFFAVKLATDSPCSELITFQSFLSGKINLCIAIVSNAYLLSYCSNPNLGIASRVKVRMHRSSSVCE